jgi:hypothetical protein
MRKKFAGLPGASNVRAAASSTDDDEGLANIRP